MLVKGFEEYFISKKNIVFERFKFNTRIQREGEPINEFITSLFTLAKCYNFGALKEELKRDRIIV